MKELRGVLSSPSGSAPLTDSQIQSVFDAVDSDKDGLVDYHEFVYWLEGRGNEEVDDVVAGGTKSEESELLRVKAGIDTVNHVRAAQVDEGNWFELLPDVAELSLAEKGPMCCDTAPLLRKHHWESVPRCFLNSVPCVIQETKSKKDSRKLTGKGHNLLHGDMMLRVVGHSLYTGERIECKAVEGDARPVSAPAPPFPARLVFASTTRRQITSSGPQSVATPLARLGGEPEPHVDEAPPAQMD